MIKTAEQIADHVLTKLAQGGDGYEVYDKSDYHRDPAHMATVMQYLRQRQMLSDAGQQNLSHYEDDIPDSFSSEDVQPQYRDFVKNRYTELAIPGPEGPPEYQEQADHARDAAQTHLNDLYNTGQISVRRATPADLQRGVE